MTSHTKPVLFIPILCACFAFYLVTGFKSTLQSIVKDILGQSYSDEKSEFMLKKWRARNKENHFQRIFYFVGYTCLCAAISIAIAHDLMVTLIVFTIGNGTFIWKSPLYGDQIKTPTILILTLFLPLWLFLDVRFFSPEEYINPILRIGVNITFILSVLSPPYILYMSIIKEKNQLDTKENPLENYDGSN